MVGVFGAKAGNAFHKLGIAAREPVSIIADIVFPTGSAMPAYLQAPVIDLQSMAPQPVTPQWLERDLWGNFAIVSGRDAIANAGVISGDALNCETADQTHNRTPRATTCLINRFPLAVPRLCSGFPTLQSEVSSAFATA